MERLKTVFQEYQELKGITSQASEQAVSRLIALAGNLPVDQYTRQHAKEFLESYGKQKTGTRRRRLGSITAVLNYAYYEYDIDKRNPFSRMIIKDEGKDATPREPFTKQELKTLYKDALSYGKLRLILPILGETGCRLSEVLGMLKDDVTREDGLLVINIRENAIRGLKTANSKRSLPVVSKGATEALERLLVSSKASPKLFPRYAPRGVLNASAASATLCKYLKANYGNKTPHCLRHSMRDRLRDADVPLEAIDQIGGWSGVGGAGTRYGKGYSVPKLAEYLERVAI